MKRVLYLFICLTFAASIFSANSFAASETEIAAGYLVKNGIYKGDESGNLNLNNGLTRAELAVILTKLEFADSPGGLAEWDTWGEKHFSSPENIYNRFTDVPGWALPYVEYCYQRGLMAGTAATLFDAHGKVNPKMACTVMLRYCCFAETDWEYGTSVEKARSVGLAPADGFGGDNVLRGTIAVMLYRGICISNARNESVPNDGTPTVSTATPEPGSVTYPREIKTISEMKTELIRLTNAERAKAGLPALKALPELMDCAQAKAQDIFVTGYHAHYSPTFGTHNDMIKSFVPGVNGGWENTTLGPASTAEEAFRAWMESSGHRANILESRTTHIGVGVAAGKDGRYAWVQQFISIKQ